MGEGGDFLLAINFCNTPVLGAPTLNKAYSDGAHVGKRIDRLKAIVNALLQQGCKVLIVENLQVATCNAIVN